MHKENNRADMAIGAAWALALFSCGILVAILINQYFERVFKVSLFLRAALIQALYAKSLRISLPAKHSLGGGAIANLQSNDAAKLWNLPNYGHVIWSAPFQVLVIIILLHTIMGWRPALAGLAVTVLLVPLSTFVGKIVHKFRKDLVVKTDSRVKLVSEVIGGAHALHFRLLRPRKARFLSSHCNRTSCHMRVPALHSVGGKVQWTLLNPVTYV
jgi:ATP-binding cassette, subfamily C (CFTR/MRP), member 1